MLVIEDHPGMREVVWDPAFTSTAFQGAFRPDHRYALRTTGTPALIDLGCWDESFHYGEDHCGEHEGEDDSERDDHSGGSVVNVSWTGDRKGVILKIGGKSTWLPMLGVWNSKGTPAGTYRGAYLNWLLQNRPTTPSIPKETRWQRLQRGANALATQLLTRSGGAPEFRIEGIGASGRLLIPPGEGLPAAQGAVSRMAPAAKGYALKDSLNGVVDMVRDLKTRGGCQPGLVIVVSDGWGLGSSCATGSIYENQAQYPVLQQQASAIAATAQAAVWAWDVEGAGLWNGVLATKGMGLSFDGDAVTSLQASIKSWMQGMGQPPQVRLSLDQPALTRFSQATLTITVDRPLSSATLNGQPISIAALTTQLPQTLKEGLNTFTVTVQTPCGTNQASLTVTLDSSAPKILLDQAPPALTNQTTLRLSGKVDDPASILTLNGVLTALDPQGRFAMDASLAIEGDNPLAFRAVDAAGNEGRLELHVQLDSLAPVITLSSPEEGLITRDEHLDVVGHVDDSHAQVQVNGQVVTVKPDGVFTAPVTLPEGPMEIRVTAADVAGNQGVATRHLTVDRTAPRITLDQSIPVLVAKAQIHLAGSVDDPSATFMLNDQPIALNAQGQFTVDVPLVEGPNPLSFRATDAAGNEGALEGSTTRDMTPPVLMLVTPAEGQRVNTAQVQLVGQVDDPMAMVTVNGQAVVPVGGAFSFTATPPEGPFSFAVMAVDPAGNNTAAIRNVLIDRSGPVISLVRPVPSLTNQLVLVLQGTVNDPTASLTLDGIAVPLDGNGAFSVEVALAEGANTFHFAALDPTGNPGALDAATIRDTVAPVITLDTPANGLMTNQGTLLVQGRVDDASARFTFNGNGVTLDAQGGFSATWALPLNGINNLTLQATDAAGNSGSLGIAVLRDAVPPKVTLTAPAEGFSTRAATIQVEGQVDKPNVQVSVNGVGAILDANGYFVATLAPSEGSYPIQATAVDVAGNSGSATRTILVDRTAPVITLSQGIPALVNTDALGLGGFVDDLKATLTLNGKAVVLDPAGKFMVTASLPAEGVNTISFEATDLVGNVGSLSLSTLRDMAPPVVKILTPQDGSGTNAHTLLAKGTLDDVSASLTVQGTAVSVGSDGTWETTVSAAKEGVLSIKAEATDTAGNKVKAVVYAAFDWTPPTIAWANPTPAEKSQLISPDVSAAVVISEPAIIAINGQSARMEANDAVGAPFIAHADVRLQEGHMVIEAEAVDRAGNKASIFRLLDVGLTKPTLQVSAPSFLPDGTYRTGNPGVQLSGKVVADDLLRPIALALNGESISLDSAGNFSVPVTLQVGLNPVHLVATTSLGQNVSKDYTITRLAGTGDSGDPKTLGVQIDWPLDGFATGSASMAVRGRVRQAGLQVQVNGVTTVVDPLSLTFTQNLTLVPGANTIQAFAQATDGRTTAAQVTGRYLQPGSASYHWDLPGNGASVKVRQIQITGQADQPGIIGIVVNGVPMSLADGRFTGTITLPSKGRNALLMEVRTLAGESRTERRDVSFQPELPRILLSAPDAARPGQEITIGVQADGGTQLQAVDLSWDGRLLGRLVTPFAPIKATIPADALVGSKLLVEALATDLQGEQVTARTSVTVYGQGALLVEAFDDRTGLLLKEGVATVEGGESRPLDASGRATLATALPTSWVQIQKAGMVPVWRLAGLKVGGVEAVVDARLTPMDAAQSAGPASFVGTFAKVLTLTLPSGTLPQETQVSATPLSTQGLPALLPQGWSAVSAWWLDAQDQAFLTPSGTGSLSRGALAVLPADTRYTWVRWDSGRHEWVTLAAGLTSGQLGSLPIPTTGGYALIVSDLGSVAPPSPEVGVGLQGYLGAAWRDGLQAAGSVNPSTLPTVEAIHGARATAELRLGFANGDPIPSGNVLQADLLESYTLVSAGVIEPNGTTQDAVASRWMLEVVDGQPQVTGAGDGLGLRLPLRMSRTFGESDLVEGRIVVGFYHDGVQLAQGGSVLMGPQGGTLAQDGVSLQFGTGAFSGSTLVRLTVDPGDPSALWPEATGLGTIAKSFQVDIVGQLLQGLQLGVADLGTPAQVPILVQRRVVQGQRVVVAVGSLVQGNGVWVLKVAEGGNPVLDGGSFAVLVPNQSWDWVSGVAVMDPGVAQGLKARMGAAKTLRLAPAIAGQATPVGDAIIVAGYLPGVSGGEGRFAVPVFTSAGPVTLQGQRWDLGVTGTLGVPVPSVGNQLNLATVPFRIVTLLPYEGFEVGTGSVMTLLLSGPADANSLANVHLYFEQATLFQPSTKQGKGAKVPAASKTKRVPSTGKAKKQVLSLQDPAPVTLVELPIHRNLSQDGKTLLVVADQPLPLGSSFQLVVDGLQGLSGEVAPKVIRRFHTSAIPTKGSVDFSRIKLTYPDEAFNITATIPVGAVPSKAVVQIEASAMGSVGTGTMAEDRDLEFTLKAALGERLKVRVQLYSGEVLEGWIGRYEANDGSGRVVMGMDGGRVEAPDGSGAAISLPEGALDGPVELRVELLTGVPDELDPEVAQREKVVSRIRLSGDRLVELKKRPVIEMPAPVNPSSLQHEAGLGPYGIFYEVNGFEADGTPAVFYELNDTAVVAEGRLRSKGGLPDLELGTAASLPMPRGLSRALKGRDESSGGATPTKSAIQRPAVSKERASFAAFGGFGLLSALSIDSGEHYLYGGAYITVGDQPRQPAKGAYIFASALGGSTPKRAGQMLGRTNQLGRYMFASSLTGELIRGGARLLGVDADYGVTSTSVGVLASGSGVFGSVLQAYPMDFYVDPSFIGDRVPPYAELGFEVKEASGSFIPVETAKPGDRLYAVVRAKDNKTPELELNLDLSVDERRHPACASGCGAHPDWNRMEALDRTDQRGLIGYRFPLDVPSVGSHAVRVLATDVACNRTEVSRELVVFAFEDEPAEIPGQAPTATLRVDPDASATRADSAVGLRFSEPVTGLGAGSLFLEYQENGAWVRETVRIYGPGGELSSGQRAGQVFFRLGGRLRVGTNYRVSWTGSVQDGESNGLKGEFPTFKTVGYRVHPTQSVEGKTLGQIVALGSRAFVVETDQATGRTKLGEWYVNGGTWTFLGGFGPGWNQDFDGHGIDSISVHEAVPLAPGNNQHLLLVTTSPRYGEHEHQAVLWGYSVCANGNPQLAFAVSLGPGASGYSPSVDCRDGLIAVGRLTSSVLLIDVQNAVMDWSQMSADQRSLVTRPGGANQRAIIQSFWLANPEDKTSGLGVLFPGTHKMVGLLTNPAGKDPAFNVAVGYSQIDGSEVSPLSGLSTSIHPIDGAIYTPQPSFVGGGAYGTPDSRAHETEGLNPTMGLNPFRVISNATVIENGEARQATLVVGLHVDQKRLIVVDVSDPALPKQIGEWSAPAGMELVRSRANFHWDRELGVLGLLARKEGQPHWLAFDITEPSNLRIVADIFQEAQSGVLQNGVWRFTQVQGVLTVDLGLGGDPLVARRSGGQNILPGRDGKRGIASLAPTVAVSVTACSSPVRIMAPDTLVLDDEPSMKVFKEKVRAVVMKGANVDEEKTAAAEFQWQAFYWHKTEQGTDYTLNSKGQWVQMPAPPFVLEESFPQAGTTAAAKGGAFPDVDSFFRIKLNDNSRRGDPLLQGTDSLSVIRGGYITLKVQVPGLGSATEKIKVISIDPPKRAVFEECSKSVDPSYRDVFLKILCKESQGQFWNRPTLKLAANVTKKTGKKSFSWKREWTQTQGFTVMNTSHGDGGMGLTQVTKGYGQISDLVRSNVLWNWKDNIRLGTGILEEKLAFTRNQYRELEEWLNRFALPALNEYRKSQGLHALDGISLPPLSDEQILFNAIRGYNGWQNKDFSYPLDFRPDEKDLIGINRGFEFLPGFVPLPKPTPYQAVPSGSCAYYVVDKNGKKRKITESPCRTPFDYTAKAVVQIFPVSDPAIKRGIVIWLDKESEPWLKRNGYKTNPAYPFQVLNKNGEDCTENHTQDDKIKAILGEAAVLKSKKKPNK
ncbi:MAG: Ig-like domain-containing protein [Acidobacteria bacterium]|nr:Ig-like domain-containing protein [Acidobacteriota bacterium]